MKIFRSLSRVRGHAGEWLIRCPYCHNQWRSDHKDFACPKCHAILADFRFIAKEIRRDISMAGETK
jgi:tRNA(Ile2) C34 agmatinyltransferase TiaS